MTRWQVLAADHIASPTHEPKFTMVTIETRDDLVTIGVRKRNGTEFVKRLEQVTGQVILQEPEEEPSDEGEVAAID